MKLCEPIIVGYVGGELGRWESPGTLYPTASNRGNSGLVGVKNYLRHVEHAYPP